MKYYKISETELKYLIRCRAELEALESGGVDNWSWYSDSRADYLEDYFSDRDPEWFEDNDLDFDLIVDEQIVKFEEV